MNGGGSLTAAGLSPASPSTADEEQYNHELPLLSSLISFQDRKDQALQVLKSDLMAKLNKEVRSLDQDSWMFDGPRSRINVISGPGGLRHRRTEIPARRDLAQQKWCTSC